MRETDYAGFGLIDQALTGWIFRKISKDRPLNLLTEGSVMKYRTTNCTVIVVVVAEEEDYQGTTQTTYLR